MKPPSTLAALASVLLAAGCSVGTYNIPDVAPVVMPEPEEDMFADLDFGGGGDESSGGGAEAAPPAEEAPAEEAAPAEAPAEKPAEAPAPKAAPEKKKK